jgi:hypothetical protein
MTVICLLSVNEGEGLKSLRMDVRGQKMLIKLPANPISA